MTDEPTPLDAAPGFADRVLRHVAIAAIAAFIVLVAIGDRFRRRDLTPGGCTVNVWEIAQSYVLAVKERRFDATLHGSAQILAWVGPIKDGHEGVLFCAGDSLDKPETDDGRRPFHPVGEDAIRRARGLGSYAVRDFEKFPIRPEQGGDPHPIVCDRQGDDGRTIHHKDGIVVGFDSGDARLFTRASLGLGPDDSIVVGPESKSPLLRVFERP